MAKKFQFRLEALLKIRSHKVEEAKDSLNEIIQLRIKRRQAIDERLEYRKQLLAPRGERTSLTVTELQAVWHHAEAVQDEIRRMEKELDQLAEIEILRREILTEAMKKEMVLQKLKEKKKQLHTEEIAREEQIFMDDIAQRKVSKF